MTYEYRQIVSEIIRITSNSHLCFITKSTIYDKKAKSRKYQGVFEVKSRVKTWQVRGIWSQQLEHKQVPQKKEKKMLINPSTFKKVMEGVLLVGSKFQLYKSTDIPV